MRWSGKQRRAPKHKRTPRDEILATANAKEWEEAANKEHTKNEKVKGLDAGEIA